MNAVVRPGGRVIEQHWLPKQNPTDPGVVLTKWENGFVAALPVKIAEDGREYIDLNPNWVNNPVPATN